MSWPKKKKNHRFELSSSLILCNNNEPFLNQIVTYNEKWILYDSWWWPAQWLDWEEAPKHFPKPNLHQKSHSHCLVVCCLSDPLQLLNLGETITSEKYAQQINEMRWKLQCLQLALVNRMGQHFNSWTNWPMKFCLIRHTYLTSCQPTTTSSSILTTFCRENISTTSRRREILSKSSLNPEVGSFMQQE